MSSSKRTIQKLRQQLREQDQVMAELRTLVKSLTKRVAELEEKLSTNSSNSSKPPSSDGPAAKAAKYPRKKPSGRKPGGQPGHPAAQQTLVPADQVDDFLDEKPARCQACGKSLTGTDSRPRRHQFHELPPIKPFTTELRLHSLVCSCGCVTTASWPKGVPRGMCGPRLQAMIAMCTGAYRLSKRTTQALLQDFLGVEISTGALKKHEQQVSTALQAPYQEAHAAMQSADVAHLDETGWRQKGKAWLWVATTSFATVFMVRRRRNSNVAEELLGIFKGFLVTDRWASYNFWPIAFRQLCWSHLKRDFTWISERRGKAGRIGRELLAEFKTMFDSWHRVRDGTLKRSSFQVYLRPIRQRIESLLEAGATCPHAKTRGKCDAILSLKEALWTFARVEGVEPTNNIAERTIRHAVIWRKICYGTQSPEGSRFVERILTVYATLRQHNRDVLGYLTEACQAALLGQPAPPLLPAQRGKSQNATTREPKRLAG